MNHTLGRYRLIRRLAGGGMAEVYLARFTGAAGFERDVVLKRIRPELAQSDDFVRMLLDEARIAATLHHPNIVQAFDVEEAGGEYFIAMEYLDGIDLRHVQLILEERDELIPLDIALHICAGLAAGLEHAHAKTDVEGRPLRIVHRDVSPHNVLLTRDGGVKLVDFGIAKAENRQTETLHGGLKGKLGYMSPEQVRNEELDHRSDLFSLGIILYELTTGTYLYAGKSEYELLNEIAEGAITPPSQIDPEYPPELERVLMKALAKDREDRYGSAGELHADLEAFAQGHGLSLSVRSLAKLVVELAAVHARARRESSTFTPWVANLAMKAGAEELSLDEVLGSLEGGAPPPGLAPGAGGSELALADTQRSTSLGEALDSLAADSVGSAQPAIATAGEVDVGAELRSGRRGLWLLTLLFAVAAAALGYRLLSHEPAPAPEPPPPPEAPPAGVLEISGAPEGAGVWLYLGETPTQSLPLSTRVPHQLRIELEEHAPRDVSVLPSRWAERRGEIGVWVTTELEPRRGGPGAAAHRVPGAPEDDGFEPSVSGEGSIHVVSSPEGADVWLLVGLLPEVSLANVRADHDFRVRVARPGFKPRVLDVSPDDFEEDDDEGLRARFEITLER
jgi:tRNA A-37 threonylcarbamoyl transferase component Bud32